MSSLSTLAASMTTGQWSALSTSNMDACWLNSGGNTNMIATYGQRMVWDSTKKRAYYLGSDHGTSTYRHIYYDDAANAWVNLGLPAWWVAPPPPLNDDAHGYGMTAVSATERKLYRNPYGHRGTIYVWDADAADTTTAGNWTSFSTASSSASGGVNGLEWFPERNCLMQIRADYGVLDEYNETTNTWTEPVGTLNPGIETTFNFMVYNPIKQLVLLGGNGGKMAKYTAAGVFTQLSDNPIAWYNDGNAGSITADPISGQFLFMEDKINGRDLWTYDVDTQTFALASSQPGFNPVGGSANNCLPCPVPEYGIILYAVITTSTTALWAYKHSPSSGTPAQIALVLR